MAMSTPAHPLRLAARRLLPPWRRCVLAATWLAATAGAQAQNPLALGPGLRTADPSAHVWADGRLYLYTSHDEECQQDFHMKDWRVFSSTDLVNWTDHGAPLSLRELSWADDYAWAPDAAYKNGRYYFVFPAGTGVKNRQDPSKSSKWMGIGIAESDSPTGPFKDMIGAPLWRTPYANDPALFIDDDGRAYLYFHGGGDYRVVELAEDLRSVRGESVKMDMGGYEPKMEGPWVFKRQGLYYFTMPENNRSLAHYTGPTPRGPWTYRGIFMAAEHGNNHHSIVQYRGQWLLFYHRWLDTPGAACAKRQRHVAAEYLQFNEDGSIRPLNRSPQGVADFATRVGR